jgi:parallel beta-helix repeat protein
LVSTFSLAFNIQPVKASGTIYIRADGSIDPPTAPIVTGDNITYTFADNIFDEIVIERSNIIIDGNDYTLQGSGDGNGFYLSETNNMAIKNTNIKDFYFGVLFVSASHNVLSANNITDNHCGVSLSGPSNYNNISENNIANNADGVRFYANNNILFRNKITNNDYGVYSGSDNNTISANNITNNAYCGINLEYSYYYSVLGNNITENGNAGMLLFYSSNDTISGNNITNNSDGMECYWSYNNSVSENNLEKNYAGLYLSACSDNTFYHNNFVDNSFQIYLSSYHPPGKNVWDNDYPSGGNYWSDYTGVDDNGDGIGDTQYNIDTINVDRYPLAKVWRPPVGPTAEHELAVFLYSPRIILLGYSSLLHIAVANKGLSNETDVQLFLLIDDVVVESVTIHLLRTNSYYAFSYNWTPAIEGMHNVTIYTPEILGEENFNNRFTKFVRVKNVIEVPDDYLTIQEAIDAAEEGYTIYVKEGTYYENIIVGKLGLRLVGESPETTIIDGNSESVVKITAWAVSVIDFTIRNGYYGAWISGSSNNTICGNNVTANSEYGIYSESSSNNVIDGNFVIKNGEGGIVLSAPGNNNITANIVTDNGGWGIDLTYYSDNNTVTRNNVTRNWDGIRLRASWYNTLNSNIVTDNWGKGIHMETASENILRDNILAANAYNFGVFTFYDEVRLSTYTEDIDTSNMVDGKPIYYVVNQRDLLIDPSDIGYLALVNCTDIHVRDVTLTNNGQGLLLAFTTNSTIENVTIADNNVGIHILSSDANSVTASAIANNRFGMSLYRSSHNNITRNALINNGFDSGFYYGCVVIGRLVMGLGLLMTTTPVPSEDNIISSNMISNNGGGIVLSNPGTARTIIQDNTISGNGEGIYVEFGASNNKIFHNNFTDNRKHVYIDGDYGVGVNVWDDGYPSGGNYWSDLNVTDLFSGPFQNESGSDGIGDTPYAIDENNIDRYPLVPYVSNPGDLNQDGTVDISDAILVAASFGSYPGHPNWNSQADLNHDNVIDIFDIIILANNFGKH